MEAFNKNELAEANDLLYDVFGKYSVTFIDSCPCCVTKDDKCSLTTKNLRELNEEELAKYSAKAMTTWGDVSDFKHFLPRIYELTAEFNPPYEEFVVFDKLNYGHWKTWPDLEVRALKNYFEAFWKHLIQNQTGLFQDYFIAIASIYQDIETLLTIWENASGTIPMKLLASEIYWNNEAVFSNKYFKSSFFTSVGFSKSFRTWIRRPVMRNKLLQTFLLCQNEEDAEHISVAYDLVENDVKLNRSI
jgi:hypothetical protein